MTFREFLREDAGIAGAVTAGNWGQDRDNGLEFAMRDIRDKYTAPENEIKVKKLKKVAKYLHDKT